jgi:hypothetical protein
MAAAAAPIERPRLRAASLEFAITPESGGPTVGKTGAVAQKVAGPLKTTVTLLEDGDTRVCLIATHMNSPKAANVSAMFRRAIADDLKLPLANVVLFVSHNHTDLKVSSNHLEAYETYRIPPSEGLPEAKLLPVGEELVFIGPGTTFLNDKYPMRRPAPVDGARIEDHVCIGGGVTVCPGVTIGRNSVIGAGSLVNKDVPPNTLAYGVPARHHPLPENLSHGNLPELLLPQTDLWGAQRDDSWKDETPTTR